MQYENFLVVSNNEYYCMDCNSAVIESYKGSDFYSSEWIDFNG